MYYEWPELEQAYAADGAGNFGQYLFGPDLLVSPVTAPVDNSTNGSSMARKAVWLPPNGGRGWYEETTGVLHAPPGAGGAVLTKDYDLTEVPVFVRGGAVIPSIPLVDGDTTGTAARQYATLEFSVFPGGAGGETRVYEDDGVSYDYLREGSYAFTTASYARGAPAAGTLTFTAATEAANATAAAGWLPKARTVVVKLVASMPPTAVVLMPTAPGAVGVTECGYVRHAPYGDPSAARCSWAYDGESLSTVVTVNGWAEGTLSLQVSAPAPPAPLDAGLVGMMAHATLAKRNLDKNRNTPNEETLHQGAAALSHVASTADALSYLAGADARAFAARVGALVGGNGTFAQAVASVKTGKGITSAQRRAYAEALLASAAATL